MSLHKYIVFYQEIDDEGDAREDCLEVYASVSYTHLTLPTN